MDPLAELFSVPSLELFSAGTFKVSHGPLERFPAWMRSGALSDLAALCSAHRGPLQAAQGRAQGVSSAPPDDFVGAGGQMAVSGTSAQALLRLGLTVVFANLAETVPAGKPFLRSLETSLGLPSCISLSAFANAPASGLPLHHDAHDQLLFQLKGTKVFSRALKPPVGYPRIAVSPDGPTDLHFPTVYRAGFPHDKDAILEDGIEAVELRPGSCLFMPAGTWHRTEQQEEVCLSLGMGVRAPSRLDLLTNALQFLAGQSSDWRQPAYGFFGPNAPSQHAAAPELEDQLRALALRLPTLDLEVLTRCFLTAQIKDGDPASYAQELKATHFLRLPNTKVHRAPTSDGRVRVEFKCALAITPGVLEFEGVALALFEHILQTKEAFSAAELAQAHVDFEAEEVELFCRQLAQVGLLRPLPCPRWA